MRRIEIPGRPALELAHLLLDVNGTLTNRGELIDDVEAKLRRLRETLAVHLVSADTSRTVVDGAEKAALVRELCPRHCVAIGNGANDAGMLQQAVLGIVVIGREGAAAATVAAADVVCHSIGDALELLLDDRALAATLRP